REPLGQLVRPECEEGAGGDDDHDRAEVEDLGHGRDCSEAAAAEPGRRVGTTLQFPYATLMRGTRSRRILPAVMRRLALFALFAALAVPAAALAAERGADDGTLSVVQADGVINVVAHGGVIGSCDLCRVSITDPVAGDGTGAVVTGWEDKDDLTDIKSRWSGADVRFKLIGGYFKL